MLTESLLIALIGRSARARRWRPAARGRSSRCCPPDFPRAASIRLNGAVFAFTFAIAVGTGLLFGLVPALQAARFDVQQGLREGGRGSTGSGRQARLRSVLVMGEVALACVLLIGAGLMLRSFVNLLRTDPGFRPEHVLTATLSLPRESYRDSAAVRRFYDRAVAELQAMPGVQAAGVGTDLPWTGYDDNTGGWQIEGRPPAIRTIPPTPATIWPRRITSAHWEFRCCAAGSLRRTTPPARHKSSSSTRRWRGAIGREKTPSASGSISEAGTKTSTGPRSSASWAM